MSSAEFVNELLALHGAGRIADMEARARVHLKSQPSSPILNELLGIALTVQRRFSEALPHLEKAVRRQPGEPQFCENLALCLRELKQYVAAERHLRRALELRPQSVEGWNALGSVLEELARPAEAETAFRAALAIDPSHPAANFNLGKLLLVPGTAAAADSFFDRALARAPGLLAAVHHCRGRYFARTGHVAGAEACYRKSLAAEPRYAAALVSLAALLGSSGRKDEAAGLCDQVLALIPDIRQAARNDPDHVLSGLANVFSRTERAAEATALYRTLCEVGDDPEIALPAYTAARTACDWEFASKIEAQALATTGLPSWSGEGMTCFSVLNVPSATRRHQLAAAKLNAARFARDTVELARRRSTSPPSARPLRIGYLSSDLHNHPVAYLVAGVIEAHDREAFEIAAYDNSPEADCDYRRRLMKGFDRVVSVREMSDTQAAQVMADDAIDIAVDLNGWTRGTRCGILASRPAPVQMQWLGYPGTSAAPWFDYIVADPVLVRPGEESDYSEKVIRLPHTYQPNDAARSIAAIPTRAEAGLPTDGVVFCSFNQAYKLTPELFSLWIDLLADVEDSILWTLTYPAGVADELRRRAAAGGVAPERLIFARKTPTLDGHLARTSLADIALDCFPYGAHTTASDALWAGVPFVALAGDTFASRVSSSVLTALGLPELITTSPRDYFALARDLATDPHKRAALRSRIAAARRSSPLFDTRRFTRNLEAAFAMAWQRHAAGLAPDHLHVRDVET